VEEGRAVTAESRYHPNLIVDRTGAVFIACWGGKINVRQPGKGWLGEKSMPSVSGAAIGFVEMAVSPSGEVLAVWEEGNDLGVHEERPNAAIVVGRVAADGTVTPLQ
jgi:hypothetical protein